MKPFIFIVLICSIIQSAFCQLGDVGLYSKDQKAVSEQIRQRLEELRPFFKTGLPEHGIPVLDPFILERAEGSVSEAVFSADFSAEHVLIEGGTSFVLHLLDAAVNPLRGTFEVSVPHVKITSDKYKLNGRILGFIPVSSSGWMEITVEDAKLWGRAELLPSGKAQLLDLDMYLDVGKVQAQFQGLSRLATNVIANNAPQMIRDNQARINKAFREQLMPQINETLGQMTLEKLLEVLLGDSIKSLLGKLMGEELKDSDQGNLVQV